MRISIVLPVLNGADVIAGALASLLDQTEVDLQIIVVDGGSSDGTLAVINDHRYALDVVISEPDAGQADALNKGFRLAEGDMVGWLCADDRLCPGALSRLGGILENAPDAVLVTGRCLRRYTWGEEITSPRPDFETRLSWMNTIEQPSTLWRAKAHRRAGELDTSLKYAFDWDFWLRLRAQGRFMSDDVLASQYVFSGENLTATGGDSIAEEMYRVIKRHNSGRLAVADAYRFLYRVFDKRGFYDADAAERLPGLARAAHHMTLAVMHKLYGRDVIDSYNWNFASRQARGLTVF